MGKSVLCNKNEKNAVQCVTLHVRWKLIIRTIQRDTARSKHPLLPWHNSVEKRCPQAVCRDVRVAFRLGVRLALTAVRDHNPVDVIVRASAAGRFIGTTAARKLVN